MVDLSRNEYHGDLSPEVETQLRTVDPRFYTKNPALRNRLGEEIGVEPDWVRIGNGAEEILIELFQTLRDLPIEKRVVLMPDRTWPVYDELISDVRARKVEFLTDGNLSYDSDAVLTALEANDVRMTVICSPNNPTSTTITPQSLERVLEKSRGIVVLDQTYLGFVGKEYDYIHCLKKHRNLVIVRSFSKLFGLAGARIGFGLMDPSTAERLRLPRRMLGASTFVERLGIAALDSRQFYEKQAERISKDRDEIVAALNSAGFFAPASRTNFVFFKGPVAELEEKLKAEGITMCVFPEGKFKGWARLGVGRRDHTEAVKRVLSQLGT